MADTAHLVSAALGARYRGIPAGGMWVVSVAVAADADRGRPLIVTGSTFGDAAPGRTTMTAHAAAGKPIRLVGVWVVAETATDTVSLVAA